MSNNEPQNSSVYDDVLRYVKRNSTPDTHGHRLVILNNPELLKAREEHKLQGAKKVLNWENIKILGHLKLLTRASYLLLIFVPILAGIWSVIARIPGGEFNTLMPSVWGWSFIAALSVIIGHLIYEVCSPIEIKRHSKEEFALFDLNLLGKIIKNSEKPAETATKENLQAYKKALDTYNKKSASGYPWIVLSGLLYIISMAIILRVVVSQLWIIKDVTGGWTEMFSWLAF